MHGNIIRKPGISEIAKPHKGGLQHPVSTPSCNGQHTDVHWVMALGHKTQSFMKNEGQKKCLDKGCNCLWVRNSDVDKAHCASCFGKYSHNINEGCLMVAVA